MKSVWIVCLVGAALAWPQAPPQDKPISGKAAWSVLNRHATALGKAVHGVTPSGRTGGPEPLKRADLIRELGRIFDQAKPNIRWTPSRPRIVESEIGRNNPDADVQAILRKLERFGCIGPVGPLVVGPGDALTAPIFGDAIAFFYLRITQICHQPDPKWTPDLRNSIDV